MGPAPGGWCGGFIEVALCLPVRLRLIPCRCEPVNLLHCPDLHVDARVDRLTGGCQPWARRKPPTGGASQVVRGSAATADTRGRSGTARRAPAQGRRRTAGAVAGHTPSPVLRWAPRRAAPDDGPRAIITVRGHVLPFPRPGRSLRCPQGQGGGVRAAGRAGEFLEQVEHPAFQLRGQWRAGVRGGECSGAAAVSDGPEMAFCTSRAVGSRASRDPPASSWRRCWPSTGRGLSAVPPAPSSAARRLRRRRYRGRADAHGRRRRSRAAGAGDAAGRAAAVRRGASPSARPGPGRRLVVGQRVAESWGIGGLVRSRGLAVAAVQLSTGFGASSKQLNSWSFL